MVLVGSHRFSVVLSRCRTFSVVLYGWHGFSKVLVCSHRSHRLSMVLTGSQWFSKGSHFCVLIDILDVQLVI